jgi:hypothetical protein
MTDQLLQEPAQGPWVPYDEVPFGKSRLSGEANGSKNSEVSGQDEPLILPVKSLDTGVINVSSSI